MVISRMALTTADVAACPTASALRPHCMPRRQPAKATIPPYTVPFANEREVRLDVQTMRVRLAQRGRAILRSNQSANWEK
jgi:hypothetical protein